MTETTPLPYRCEPDDLLEWVEARARGRTHRQLRASAGSPKAAEGIAATAAALGFWDPVADGLTDRGEALALAAPAERVPALRAAVLAYPPYRALLAEVVSRPAAVRTEVGWIETWWATHGFGSSESNRREGAATLGRFAERVALGRYVPGRRGHPTRIEWSADLPRLVAARAPLPPDPVAPSAASATPPPAAPPAPAPVPRAPDTARSPNAPSVNQVTLDLADRRTARLEVPTRLPRAEKRRLLDLLDLLIAEE